MAAGLPRLSALASLLDPQAAAQPVAPDTIKRRRALAEQLAMSATGPRSSSNNLFGAIAQGLDGFTAGRMERQANDDEKAGYADLAGILAKVPRVGGASGTASSSSAIPTFATPQGQSLAGITPAEDLAVRTVIGEARGEGAIGQAAVAGVIRNRAAGSGQDFGQVVLAKNQFEPWASRRGELMGYDPNSAVYQQAAAATLPVLRGEAPDPTGGATHFYAPKAQAAMGRAAPRWDNGTGRDLGNHRFFDLGYGGGGRDGIGRRAEADMPMDGAIPVADEGTGQPGFQIPGQPEAPPLPVGAPIPPQMQPQQAPPDMQALFDRQPMAPAQSFAQDAALPEIEATGARNVPLPPQRPSVAALLAAPAQAQPSPQAAAMPVDGVSQPQTGAPMQADAPPPAQRSGLAAILGDVQDGLDGVFGGEQTQERLRRQAMADALAGDQPAGASPQSRQLAQALMQPTENGSAMPASAVPQPTSYTGGPRRSPVVGALTGGPDAGPAAMPPAPMGQGQRGAPAQMAQPGAQPNVPAGDERDLFLRLANHPYASAEIRSYAIDQLNPKLSHVDLGDNVGFVDPSGRMVRTYPKTKSADFGEVGRDAYGNPISGFRNYGQQSVNVPQVPGNASGQVPIDMNGRAVPQGVDPKIVRDAQSKSYAEGSIPATGAATAELRKEVLSLPSYKNLTQAAPIYRSMADAAGRNTKASDLNLIYGLGKIMDPGSVVREGEMVMANNTQGIQERLNGMISSIQGGALLTPATRQALMTEAFGRMQAYENEFTADSGHYRGIAGRGRMNADDVVPTFDGAKPWQTPTAQPQQSGQQTGPVSIKAPEQLQQLPVGTTYRAPDGSIRRKR